MKFQCPDCLQLVEGDETFENTPAICPNCKRAGLRPYKLPIDTWGFWLIFLAPPMLSLICAAAGRSSGDSDVYLWMLASGFFTFLSSGVSALVCANRLTSGQTGSRRVLTTLGLSVLFYAFSVLACFVGCALGGGRDYGF